MTLITDMLTVNGVLWVAVDLPEGDKGVLHLFTEEEHSAALNRARDDALEEVAVWFDHILRPEEATAVRGLKRKTKS